MRASKRARRERLYPEDIIFVMLKLLRNFDIAIEILLIFPPARLRAMGKLMCEFGNSSALSPLHTESFTCWSLPWKYEE